MNKKDRKNIEEGLYLKDWLITRLFLLVVLLCLFIMAVFLITAWLGYQDDEEFNIYYLIGALGPLFILVSTFSFYRNKMALSKEKFSKFY